MGIFRQEFWSFGMAGWTHSISLFRDKGRGMMAEKKWAAEAAGRELSILKCRSNGAVWKSIQIIDIDLKNRVQLAVDLNELESYRDERRWRVIGDEWPDDGQLCQLENDKSSFWLSFFVWE